MLILHQTSDQNSQHCKFVTVSVLAWKSSIVRQLLAMATQNNSLLLNYIRIDIYGSIMHNSTQRIRVALASTMAKMFTVKSQLTLIKPNNLTYNKFCQLILRHNHISHINAHQLHNVQNVIQIFNRYAKQKK